MKKYYVEIANKNHMFKCVVPAPNYGVALIMAWEFVEKYASNLLEYNFLMRKAEKNEEYGWKAEELKKEE